MSSCPVSQEIASCHLRLGSSNFEGEGTSVPGGYLPSYFFKLPVYIAFLNWTPCGIRNSCYQGRDSVLRLFLPVFVFPSLCFSFYLYTLIF